MTGDARQRFVDPQMQWSEEQYDYIHPDCVISHPPVLQYGGTKNGPAGMKSIIDGLAANFELHVEKVETQLFGDDLVVQRFLGATFVNRKSGRRATMNVVEIYRFDDGLCVEQDNFYKSPEIVAEMIAEAGYVAP
ncbi:nuclear transport factor 2 family protein [Trujillonella endophytica]|uniref:SnoaL-like domain-containing protein n=1 Tax=Trujillonella endophytica TaxID=673521 RepID=A0A1H8QTV1_9ACTN|nr:nuclear transport factor 2 family protein [Trujillella endophytica]SEO57689.1 SnoaL-like domain-containing protein [Trujillella endophytica]